MIEIGTIKEIWRYPVKSMAGEQLESCVVAEQGLHGDRRWALRDVRRAEIQSCKARPQLLQCAARCRADDAGQVEVSLPDGAVVDSDDATIHQRLATQSGHPSELVALRPAEELAFYRRYKREDGSWLDELVATFDREAGELLPDFLIDVPQNVADFVSAPGAFFLVTPLHLITTATLAHLRGANAQGEWDARRFRQNFLIETTAALSGLAEQTWLGKRLKLGAVEIDCVSTTPRCGAVTRAQPTLGVDKSILRTIVRDADQNLGIYGMTATSGELRVGDSMQLL